MLLRGMLICCAVVVVWGAEQLPESASGALKAYDTEIAKAKAEYDKRDEAAKRVLVAGLKKAQDVETKAGNLEGALAIKRRIEELMPKGDLLGENKLAIVGKWKRDKGSVFEFKPDGTGTSDKDGAINWTVDKKGMIVVSYVGHANWRDMIEIKSANKATLSVVADPSNSSEMVRIQE